MNYQQAWNIFEQTGNIDAYLLYKQLKVEEERKSSEEQPGEPYLMD
ncbi:MAG: YqzL family protein [Clostridia bacterium]|nr:YqzL family protein [Clostridia bacterium]